MRLLVALSLAIAGYMAPLAEAGNPRMLTASESPSRPQQLRKGVFLVAKRDMRDPNFRQAVVLLIRHDRRGTLGLVINRRSRIPVAKAFPNLPFKQRHRDFVYFGGPVGLHQAVYLLRLGRPSKDVRHVFSDIYFGADRGVLERAIKRGLARRQTRFYLGHAGWSAGQLVTEMRRGDWHIMRAHTRDVFAKHPQALWHRLIRRVSPAGMVVQR